MCSRHAFHYFSHGIHHIINVLALRHATTEPAAFIERTYDAAAYARMRDDAARTGAYRAAIDRGRR